MQHYRLIISGEVFKELVDGKKTGSEELRTLLHTQVCKSAGRSRIQGLGAGESSVITLWNKEKGDFVILDDKKGANYCKANGIPFLNSLLMPRVLFLAGIIGDERCREATRQLVGQGYYSKKIITKAAALAAADLESFLPSLER